MTELSLKSFAKLNLVLDLLFKRPDSYHEVEFVMQELELHDTMSFKLMEEPKIVLECSDKSIYCDERNLAFKAAELLQKKFSPGKGIQIFLEKRIPMIGGLGGSSSNVAATIKALNQLWSLNLSQEQMVGLAAEIGMDCAFSILGGTCIARGRGDLLERTESPAALDIVLATPNIQLPEKKTAWIYSNFDVSRVKEHPSVKEMVKAISSKNKRQIAKSCGNAFEQGLDVKEYEPVWSLLKDLKQKEGVLNACLAGSGPTVFAITEKPEQAEALKQELSSSYDVFTTKTRA